MDPATRPSSTRRVLILLVVLAGALLALSIVQRDRALEKEYEDAQVRAELYAATVFRSTLGPLDVATPLEGNRRDSLLAEVEAFVLVDPKVARVRLWSPDGTLLFSTDPADNPGETSQDPSIATAAGGAVQSRLAAEPISSVEGDRRATPLFQTFAPLRVRGSANVVGAVEVEQSAAALEKRADDPWWLVQAGASGATVLLALMALIAVARGMRRAPSRRERTKDDRPSRKKRPEAGWDDGGSDLQDRLERATARAKEAEAAAQSFAASLQQVSNRLEAVEGQSSDERVAELKESLRRSEAERAMLRAGRPETLVEAEVRELRAKLRDSQALAKAAEALVAGGGDLSAVQEQLSTAARQVDAAVERAKIAEGRADAAEDRARATGDLATAAEQRIDMLEIKLQEIVAGVGAADGPELVEVQRHLDEARQRADEMARRATEAESRLAVAGSLDGPAEELLQNLEIRVVAAEARAVEAESRLRSFEEEAADGGSRFRQRLGLSAAGRKLAAPTPVEQETLPEMDLRSGDRQRSPWAAHPCGRAHALAPRDDRVGRGQGRTAAALVVVASRGPARRRPPPRAPDHRRELAAEPSAYGSRRAHRGDPGRSRHPGGAAHPAGCRHRPRARGLRPAPGRSSRACWMLHGNEPVRAPRSWCASATRMPGARVSVEDDNRIPATIGAEMSLAVRLAELHGTEITVDGSSYRVVFPKDEGP